jgi:hypothetical protein
MATTTRTQPTQELVSRKSAGSIKISPDSML